MDDVKPIDCEYVQDHDLVKSYLGGTLSEEEAEAFELHYFACDHCWEEVQRATEVRAASEKGSPSAVTNSRRETGTNWRLLAIAASVAVAVFAGLTIARGIRKSPVEAVASAAGFERTTEARLTGGFRHSDFRPQAITRGRAASKESWRLERALETARQDIDARSSTEASKAEATRAVGLGELLMGKLDQAVATLTEASKKYPEDARILSDLAAAHFARFEAQRSDEDLEKASDVASHAVALDPKLKEARFNRALILERLGYRGAAAEEWDRYLAIERDSGWAAEAKKHRDRQSPPPLSESWPKEKANLRLAAARPDRKTVSRIVNLFPERSRQYVEDEVLPHWAEQGDTSSSDLAVAREIGDIFRAEHDDSFLADSVALIDASLRGRTHPDTLARLLEAHRTYGLGRRCYKEPSIEDARRLYGEAEDLFESVGSPFRDLAIAEGATCLFYESRPVQILAMVAPVAARSRERYPQLFASAQWLAGVAEISLGHPSEALRFYSETLAAFQRVRDPENVASVHYLIGEVYQDLGEFELAAQNRRQALTMLTQTGEHRRLYVAFQLAGMAAQQAELPELTRVAYSGAVQTARVARDPDLMTHALVASAKAEYAFGNGEVAARSLRDAAVSCRAIRDPSLRARASAELSIAAGQLNASVDPARSFRELDSAATFFSAKGDLARVAAIRFERGKLHLAARESRLAKRDFEAAIDIVEDLRTEIPSETTRVSFFENTQDLFDQTIGAFAADGQVARAAEVVEQARARALLDMIQKSVPAYTAGNLYDAPLHGDELAKGLPPLTTVVEYAVLDDRLLVFTIQAAGLRLTTVPVSRARLEDLTAAFVNSLTPGNARGDTGPRTASDVSGILYELLINPIRPELQTSSALVFVPDKSLHRLPFAGLKRPGSHRYLVEEFQLSVAPSATIYLRCLDRYRRLGNASAERVLVVANPRFDRRLLPDLPPLLEADREARNLADFYPNCLILSGPAATKRRVILEAPASSVIHFASHALVETNSILSKLVLAPEPSGSDSGLLYAHEIPALSLPRTRIVILSACDTLGGPLRGGEGIASLARTFLAAGVPAVVGTLTPVEDRVAAAVLTAFHHGLSKGLDPVSALRDAQLSLLRGTDIALRSPSNWAAFELIGGTLPS